jgi:hypothetical protein
MKDEHRVAAFTNWFHDSVKVELQVATSLHLKCVSRGESFFRRKISVCFFSNGYESLVDWFAKRKNILRERQGKIDLVE